MSVKLQQVDEQDKVLKRKARFGTITAPSESVSMAVCIHFCCVLCVGLYACIRLSGDYFLARLAELIV